jgi:lipid A 3-O-deacylase
MWLRNPATHSINLWSTVDRIKNNNGSGKRGCAVFIVCLVFCWFYPAPGWCGIEAPDEPLTFTFYWENDLFANTDRDYTNGLKLTWSKPYTEKRENKGGLTPWMINRLPFVKNPDASRAISFSLGQSIYTPTDTEQSQLVEDDRPYAGYTYVGFGFHSQKGQRRDTWELDAGLVGPLSQAETVNNYVHDALKLRRFKGWEHQLKNEIGIEAIYETRWRLWQYGIGHGFGADLVTHLGGSFGNIAIHANGGGEFRLGWFVPRDFGTCPIRAGCDAGLSMGDDIYRSAKEGFGAYLFFSAESRLVLRDIFLDGNTFQDSHGVEKETLVADYMTGVALYYGRMRLSYALVQRTKEFKKQDQSHAFGAVSLSYIF